MKVTYILMLSLVVGIFVCSEMNASGSPKSSGASVVQHGAGAHEVDIDVELGGIGTASSSFSPSVSPSTPRSLACACLSQYNITEDRAHQVLADALKADPSKAKKIQQSMEVTRGRRKKHGKKPAAGQKPSPSSPVEAKTQSDKDDSLSEEVEDTAEGIALTALSNGLSKLGVQNQQITATAQAHEQRAAQNKKYGWIGGVCSGVGCAGLTALINYLASK